MRTRARTWTFMVPLHLIAFWILYIATVRLLETEVLRMASDVTARELDLANRQLTQIAVAHTQNRVLKHFFEAVLDGHQSVYLKLLLPNGTAIGPEPAVSQAEVAALPAFVDGSRSQHIWLSEEGDRDWMRGFQKVIATPQCGGCHALGTTLAIASIRRDVTGVLSSVRGRSRRNVAILIVAWATALGFSSALVRASVKRSARKLEEELAAAEAGVASSNGSSDLVLDSTTARLHRSLQQFLERHRRRQEEVASKLAHTDQLASLGRLAAGLAHEIKNPLAGIQGALEIMIQDAAEEDPDRELYGEMLNELGRVNETLQTLLQSARPAPARLAFTDLRQLLDDLFRLLEPGLRRKRIVLKEELAEGELMARIDGPKLRQVLVNLVQNAAEAIGENGEIVIRASVFPGGGLVVAVQDNGAGIPEETQDRIFEPFFTTKFAGTGLGLAITRSLVEQQGGTLEVQSAPGEGATFYIMLPGSESRLPEGEVESDQSEAI